MMKLATLDDDTVLPEQFYPTGIRGEAHELLSIVFMDAIYGLIGQIVTPRKQWDIDHAWLMSDDSSPLAFRWYCKSLDLNAAVIREKVLKNLKEPYKRPAKRRSATTKPRAKPVPGRRPGRPASHGMCALSASLKDQRKYNRDKMREHRQRRRQACLTSLNISATG